MLSASLPPWAAGVSVPGGKLVGCIDAGGLAVAIRKQRGHANLLLEVLMRNGKKQPARPVDSGTPDVARATENAVALAGELAAQVGLPGEEPVVNPPTYGQLLDEIARRGGADEKNLKAQLRSWMRVFSFDADNTVSDEFGAVFDVYRENFRHALRHEGKAESTISPYLSRISKLLTIVSGLLSVSTTDRTFGQVLKAAMRAKGVSAGRVAGTAGVARSAITRWLSNGGFPSAETQERIPAVERLLGLPAGTLTSLLSQVRPASRGSGRFAAQLRAALMDGGFTVAGAARAIDVSPVTLSDWCDSSVPTGKRRTDSVPRLEVLLGVQPGFLSGLLEPVPLSALCYAHNLTDKQQLEWNRLVRHKTFREELDEDRRPRKYWRVKSDGSSVSAELYHGEVSRFYGFLALPENLAEPRNSGRGLDPEQLSLIDLACRQYVKSFTEFRAVRTGYNSQTRTFLAFVMSLLRAGTGYLWQGRGFDWRSFPECDLEGPVLTPAVGEITIDRWRLHCETLHAKLDQWSKHLDSNGIIKRTRTYDHIAPILRAQHPIDYLVRLETELRRDLHARWKRLSPVCRAKEVRNLLLVSMMIQNPLRGKHWQIMTWRDGDPRSHLIKTSDGNYGLRYSMEDFKSFPGSQEEDYEAEFDSGLTPLLDEYLCVHRPHLVGAGGDYVFQSSKAGNDQKRDERFSIYKVFVTLTEKYLAGCLTRGFGPHGVRHIIATELVKNEPGGIQLAADALHNTPAMIHKHYGHLRNIDRTNRARRIVGSALADARDRLGVDPVR